ncbi:potassium channel family protein [uncultured Demequina sp.]|uniref:potassium channel family protein n=1 Tax=uncultured Demequina sp. TaxID=693499 RepID=UPI0025CC6C37|nr:potassium channel family protein [uncultured Demequina sp.]
MTTSAAEPSDDTNAPVARLSSLWLLLGSLALLQFGYPVTEAGQGWTIVYLLVYGGVIGYVVLTARADAKRYWPLLALAAAAIVGGTWFAIQQDSGAAQVAMLAGVGMLQLALLIVLAAALIKPPTYAQVSHLLLIAVCAYLLLGGVFGVAASLMELQSPGSFTDPTVASGTVPWQSLFYASYVTLATLGFGDVVPTALWARSLLSLEAVVGTLFVAVVIARLVGVIGARHSREG